MQKVIIVGAGGHAAEMDDYIRYSRKKGIGPQMEVIGLIDDNPDSYNHYQFKASFLGPIATHKVMQDADYLIGIANLEYRRSITEKLLAEGARFATFIHPDIYLSNSASIGQGVIIAPNVNVGPNVVIGDFTLINARCSLGHDSKIGRFNLISPNVCFSGFTAIGDENLFGINSATIPGIKVGNRNKIAAGMVLDRNVDNDSTIFYRHKERVIAIPKPPSSSSQDNITEATQKKERS